MTDPSDRAAQPSGVPAGAATGLGPLPGTDIDETLRSVAGELPVLPFLPQLADRGVGADPIGRTLAHLVDIHAEVVPSGWRICSRPGRDARRSTDHRSWDADALEQHLAAASMLKIQLIGPWSLAAGLELPNGHRAVSDHGATADLAASLAEGIQLYLADLGRRLPHTRIMVQVDEPELDRVLSGELPTPSGFDTVRSVAIEIVQRRLGEFRSGLGDRPSMATGPRSRWNVLRAAGFDRLVCSLDEFAGDTKALDEIGRTVQDGVQLAVLLGSSSLAVAGRTLLTGCGRIGFAAELLASSVIPLAGVEDGGPGRPEDIAGALAIARQLAEALADPPDSWR